MFSRDRFLLILPIIIFLFAIPFGDIMFTDTDISRLTTKLLNFFNPNLYLDVSISTFFNSVMQTPKYVLASTFIAFIIIFIEFFCINNRLVAKKNYKFLRTNLALSILLILMALLISGQGWEYAAYGQR